MPVAIRRPIAVDANHARIRPPGPTEVIRVSPIAIRRQIFRAPDILVVILHVVLKPLREKTLAVVDPIVDSVGRSGSDQIPIARTVSTNDQLRGTSIAQSKTRSIGINSRTPTVAHGKPHTPVARRVDPVKTGLFSGHRAARRVDFKILAAAIEIYQTDDQRSFNDTKRDSFVAQSYNAQRRIRREAEKVARIDLDLEPAVFAGRDGIAFDNRIIEPGALPVGVAVTFEISVAGDVADAHDASFHVVIIGLVVVVGGAGGNGDREESE
jgi:hypothetical protein